MDATHTPGPFFVKYEDDGYFEVMDGPDPSTANTLCTRFEWKEREAEMRANGNLFGAAPDLLSALEEARNGLRWYQDTYPDMVNGCDDEAMERIDAALAKATGVAP